MARVLLFLVPALVLATGCDDDSMTLFRFDVLYTTRPHALVVQGDVLGGPLPNPVPITVNQSTEFTFDLDDEGEFASRTLDFITSIVVKALELRVEQESPLIDPTADSFDFLGSATIEVRVVDPLDPQVTEVVATATGPFIPNDRIIFACPEPNVRNFVSSTNEITIRVTVASGNATIPPDDVLFHISDGSADGGMTIEVGAGIRG